MTPLPSIVVLKSAGQTTIQDLGRTSLVKDGIPPAGAFDALSLKIANKLVGNDPGDWMVIGSRPGAAGLEVLMGGLSFVPTRNAVIAVSGAEADVAVDDAPAEMWKSIQVPAGARVSIGPSRHAARVYVAIDGGINVPPVLGSRATHVRARLGGLGGRALRQGDVVPLEPGDPHDLPDRWLSPDRRPKLSPPWALGVVLGPQDYLFTSASVDTFLATEWKMSHVADRMGCRFLGPPLSFRERPDYLIAQAGSDPSNIVDDMTHFGGIQVPSGLEPIAMGVEFPSIGGYAKIATLISTHVSRLGQIRPGDSVRFVSYSLEAAVAELRACLEPASFEPAVV